jgi:hypothetical protein
MTTPIAQGPVDVNVRGWKGRCMHKNLGEVFVTVDCLALQLQNPDPTSLFVEHDGEIKEVSRAMMEAPNNQ